MCPVRAGLVISKVRAFMSSVQERRVEPQCLCHLLNLLHMFQVVISTEKIFSLKKEYDSWYLWEEKQIMTRCFSVHLLFGHFRSLKVKDVDNNRLVAEKYMQVHTYVCGTFIIPVYIICVISVYIMDVMLFCGQTTEKPFLRKSIEVLLEIQIYKTSISNFSDSTNSFVILVLKVQQHLPVYLNQCLQYFPASNDERRKQRVFQFPTLVRQQFSVT